MPSTWVGSTSEKQVFLTKKEKYSDKAKSQEKKLKEYIVPKKEYIVPKKEKAPDTISPRPELKKKEKVKPSNWMTFYV